ncbi:DNA adenine methylase [Oxalicibacterium faecigallinarum]|uniref:Site-specific DNA-methyltransferase n=1 Tax=Oxalicibacterium faecigallinarum TaxID=573741 RepID=A0A8J3F2Y2_9BURK|nr:DNA adenine methylase [Oxalicibacterium faecigallinarum]GGI19146.1 site-specific DNA-methyltransferase [Oxalicibacterium faecigallinarum]
MAFQKSLAGRAGEALLFSEFESSADVAIGAYRPIYYLGCKAAFTDAIKSAVDAVSPAGGTVLDLFAGTGAVAYRFADDRDVITVDVQEYSRVLCSAALRTAKLSSSLIDDICAQVQAEKSKALSWFAPMAAFEASAIFDAHYGNFDALIELLESPPLIAFEDKEQKLPHSNLGEAIKETISRLESTGLELSECTTISRNFGGVYFSFDQALSLDAMISVAHRIGRATQDTLIATALSTASSLVNTVGKHFAQPIQPRNKSGIVKPGLAKSVSRDRSLDALETYRAWLEKYSALPTRNRAHQAIRTDFAEALRLYGPQCSVVYADPPYTRDHYSRFYHVLETMCLRDNPKVSRVVKDGRSVISRGVYREDRHQSPFSIRSTAPKAFETLFKTARDLSLPVVLSYSPHEEGDGTHPRVVSMGNIIELAQKYYPHVEIDAIDGVTHNQLNRNGLKLKKREQAEVILKCFT